ncbi:MAG: hypothetical protein KZQ77_11530 [Candidatus Thiodiazotropha sp. (ex Notomyrtea botanica)]|nr:hypothetical protein [Candidatus Thiodiazotropha sp. (ex Notomyrtea botanica)]
MESIDLKVHEKYITDIINKHIAADLVFCESKAEMNDKIAMSLWNGNNAPNKIMLLSHISNEEIENHIAALGLRGVVKEKPELLEYVELITTPQDFLKHLVLHEVAHIKNNWSQKKETECDLWAFKVTKHGN